MYERLEDCPLCGYKESKNYLICKDYTITQESFAIVKCIKCKFQYTNPRPTEENIGKYYQSEEYVSHSDTKKGVINTAYHIIKQKAIYNKLKLINKIHKKGTLLDIGCGTGSFIEVCKKNGWQVKGIEPNEKARVKAEEKIKNEVQNNLFSLSSKEKFDIITMWHVLEHVHKLEATLQKISTLLDKAGNFVIAVPNNNSYDAKLYKEYWAAYDVPRHLYHFNKETTINLLKKYNFKLIEISPMKFDAFYISLLSYKYKNNKMDYTQALIEGFKSNKWAAKNDNNFSSLTFVFSK